MVAGNWRGLVIKQPDRWFKWEAEVMIQFTRPVLCVTLASNELMFFLVFRPVSNYISLNWFHSHCILQKWQSSNLKRGCDKPRNLWTQLFRWEKSTFLLLFAFKKKSHSFHCEKSFLLVVVKVSLLGFFLLIGGVIPLCCYLGGKVQRTAQDEHEKHIFFTVNKKGFVKNQFRVRADQTDLATRTFVSSRVEQCTNKRLAV